MSNVKKPEPLCYRKEEYEDGVLVDVEYNGSDSFSGGRSCGIPLVPVAQVEAYKDACVQEALEHYERTLRNGLRGLLVFDRNSVDLAITDSAAFIRALIPKQQPSSG